MMIVLVHNDLYHAIQKADLERIKTILSACPKAIHQMYGTNNRGYTPLFLAVKNNLSTSIIHHLLLANPKAASIPNSMGEIPLHITRSTETAQLLLQFYPQGIYKQTKAKWLPIHTARTSELTHLFLQQGSSLDSLGKKRCGKNRNELMLFSRDEAGLTPLEKLATSLEFCLSCTGTAQYTPLNHVTAILWDKLCLLTKAMVNYYMYFQEDVDLSMRDRDHKGFQMVHSWIGLRDMMVGARDWVFFGLLLEVALDLYPEQVCQKDALDRTPLLVSLAGRCGDADDNDNADCGCDNSDCGCDNSECDEMTSYNTVHLLLQRSQKLAGMPDRNERMPLHIVVRSKRRLWHKGGIRDIAMAEPTVLTMKDPQTNLYPFMLAASGGESPSFEMGKSAKGCRRLDKIYFLLREAPEVMKFVDDG